MRPHSRSFQPILAISLFLLLPAISSAQTTLPSGSSPPALTFPHFPDRTHTFIWRNWNLVETSRLAKVLDTSPGDVRAMADAMGLPPEEAVGRQIVARMYLTIIRRNWHLLPYDQLLQLLGWPAERLAHTLREDDFFFMKLGLLKPKCERLTYEPPDEKTRAREREIRQIVEREFGDAMKRPAEPRFAFLNQFNKPVADDQIIRAPADGLRFIYSYFAVYGDPLSDPSLDPYPDGLLQQLAARGVNGVWLHTVLRDLAPSKDFPEFGAGHERRLENLRNLVNRARRFGIGVYLYMNEPRAMPVEFFKNRPEMAGVREGDYVAMCTSSPVVRAWLSDSLEYVFTNVPHLGGVFTITASENLTNCASHHKSQTCPRCGKRSNADVIAEVNGAIEQGVHQGNPDAKVIVWDWGWLDADTPDIIAHLPKSVWLMSVSEWALPLNRGGIHTTVGEYSLSAVGPGPRATEHWALAREAGLKTVAKIQINNTWEISAVPYLPVLDLVAEHCHNLASANVDGLMLSWSLGGYPSVNLEVAGRLMAQPAPTADHVLNQVALERFGPEGASHARKAWTLFSKAFAEYPYNGSVLYDCPVQMGPANLLFEKPTGYRATMVGLPYDALDNWRGPYPRDVFISQFQKLADGWDMGIDELKQAADLAPATHREQPQSDLRVARAAGLHFRSVINQAKFVIARDALTKPSLSPESRALKVAEIHRLLADEISAAVELYFLARQDSRIGFEASNQYYYVPQDLIEKVLNCLYLAEEFK